MSPRCLPDVLEVEVMLSLDKVSRTMSSVCLNFTAENKSEVEFSLMYFHLASGINRSVEFYVKKVSIFDE